MHMNVIKNVTLAALLAAMAGLSGCGGGGAEVRATTTTVSQGQELQDLKKALDSGAINQQEYDRLRKKIIERSN